MVVDECKITFSMSKILPEFLAKKVENHTGDLFYPIKTNNPPPPPKKYLLQLWCSHLCLPFFLCFQIAHSTKSFPFELGVAVGTHRLITL